MAKNKQINFRVDPRLFEALKQKADQEMRELSEIIRELLVKWLKK
jgi:hypothetical protein